MPNIAKAKAVDVSFVTFGSSERVHVIISVQDDAKKNPVKDTFEKNGKSLDGPFKRPKLPESRKAHIMGVQERKEFYENMRKTKIVSGTPL